MQRGYYMHRLEDPKIGNREYNEIDDDQNDMADGCAPWASPPPESVPNPVLEPVTSPPAPDPLRDRLDHHPGQGFLSRLRRAHAGISEKE